MIPSEHRNLYSGIMTTMKISINYEMQIQYWSDRHLAFLNNMKFRQ